MAASFYDSEVQAAARAVFDHYGIPFSRALWHSLIAAIMEPYRLRDMLRETGKPHDPDDVAAWLQASMTVREAREAPVNPEIEQVYLERNRLVAVFARLALIMGWRAGLGAHDPTDATWDPEWRTIVYVEHPNSFADYGGRMRQSSWHIHDRDLPLFAFLGPYTKPWDGHTTEEKYDRLHNLCNPPDELK